MVSLIGLSFCVPRGYSIGIRAPACPRGCWWAIGLSFVQRLTGVACNHREHCTLSWRATCLATGKWLLTNMRPPEYVIQDHLSRTAKAIASQAVPCVLCGDISCVPGVWIVPDDIGAELNLPYNRYRTIGYSLCSECVQIDREDLLARIEDVLIEAMMNDDVYTPRMFPPAIFLN